MGHHVTSDDSDYFIGYCDCDQLPCLSCVAAQRRIEAYDKLRGELVRAYYDFHQHWPMSTFIDRIFEAFRAHDLGHNLAVAGALCKSFALGEYLERGKWDGLTAQPWSPGCKKTAP